MGAKVARRMKAGVNKINAAAKNPGSDISALRSAHHVPLEENQASGGKNVGKLRGKKGLY